MSIRISPITGDNKPHVGRPVAVVLLALAIALIVGSAGAVLSAQDPAQGLLPDLPVPAKTTPAAKALQGAPSGSYLINSEDVLDVYVYDVPELSREYTVNAAGTITVPLLPNQVQAAGLSPDELARSLEESFRKAGRLSHPQITVSIKQSRWSVVTVEGAVKSPQAVPVIGRTKLVSVLTQCGGRADDAGSTFTVTRGELALHELGQAGAPASPSTTVDFKKLMDPDDPTSKFEVWPGDRVSVEHAGLFYVLGQVVRPGGYNLKSAEEQVTVLEALALAGDATPIAKVDRTVLIRKNPKAPNGREEIGLNVHSILTGHSPDNILRSDDILYVPSSKGKRTLRGLGMVGQAMASAAGAAVVYAR